DYMERAVAVNRAFWSWNVHGIGAAMISIRPPTMTFMGLPWGPLTSWEAAGNCFITLAAAISLLAALCLYLLLRIGVKPTFLAVASVCGVGPTEATAQTLATARKVGFTPMRNNKYKHNAAKSDIAAASVMKQFPAASQEVSGPHGRPINVMVGGRMLIIAAPIPCTFQDQKARLTATALSI